MTPILSPEEVEPGEGWTGRKCANCKGNGLAIDLDGEERACPSCAGTGDEYGLLAPLDEALRRRLVNHSYTLGLTSEVIRDCRLAADALADLRRQLDEARERHRERAKVAMECVVTLGVIADAHPGEALCDFARDTLAKILPPQCTPPPASQIDAMRAKWLPISEAKKDGSRYLLAKIVGHPEHPTALWWVVCGHWSSKWNNWNDGIEPSGLADPTHYLPLDAIQMPEPSP